MYPTNNVTGYGLQTAAQNAWYYSSDLIVLPNSLGGQDRGIIIQFPTEVRGVLLQSVLTDTGTRLGTVAVPFEERV